MTRALDYRAAGVDIDAAEQSKERIRRHVESTMTSGARGAFGGFGGMFRAPSGDAPLLVASADGVGTKIKVAIDSGRHDTIGHDLVNHCTNDILVQGATPRTTASTAAGSSLPNAT
jgi:phosphoribosylformylglycinamidine cyclo-ligase